MVDIEDTEAIMADRLMQTEIDRKLQKIKREAEERDAKRRAAKNHLPYIDLSLSPVQIDALAVVPKEQAEKAQLAVLERRRDTVAVAVYDPEKKETKTALKELEEKHLILKISVCSQTGLERIWQFYEFVQKTKLNIVGKIEIDKDRLVELRQKLTTLETVKAEIKQAIKDQLSVGQVLEILLAAALTLSGSDIHLEPEEKIIKFRLRIDGLLHDVFAEFNHEDYFFIISRIKLLSEMKLNIHDTAQDGRFTVNLGEKEVEVRSSVLPSKYGETAVLRILDPDIIRLKLEELGLRGDELEIIKKELARPNGMILNTGPTGSGKTTTLYSFLMHVNTPESKVITIENPIEYRIPGIEQTQVDPEAGYTFENGLRAIVRQDPDVLLIGEIRDLETADIALNASLTGHLVFSTLHTNDSFGAIPRLIDLGAKTAIIGPALNLVIAQRLVRRLCLNCRTEEKPTPEAQRKIDAFLRALPKRVPIETYKNRVIYKKAGCKQCGEIGYKGRIAIMEVLQIDDVIANLISKDVSEVDIRKSAEKSQGVITVQESGILKALEGITTLEEVERITGPLEW